MSSEALDVRMARLEGVVDQLDRRLGDLGSSIDARFAQVDARFAQVDARFDALDRKVDSSQWRMTALIVGTWIATMSTILIRH
jgi:hypothetical protein